jgi:hypothetical protein
VTPAGKRIFRLKAVVTKSPALHEVFCRSTAAVVERVKVSVTCSFVR